MHKGLTLVFLTLLGSSSLVYADDEIENLFAMSLDELLQVEITGSTQSKEDIYTVPSSVTVYTYEQIRKMSVNSLEELMNYVPGFQSNRAATYTNQYDMHTRGGPGQGNVLVLYDGQRLNMDWAGSAMTRNQLLSLENIEKVEFIRGPGSALYGSNSFSGVINLITKKDLSNIGTRFNGDYVNGYMNYAFNEGEFGISAFVKGLYDSGQSYDAELDPYTGTFRSPKDKNSGSEAYIDTQYENFTLQLRHIRRDTQGWYALGYNSDQSDTEGTQDFIRVGYTYDKIQNLVSELYISYIQGKAKADYLVTPSLLATATIKEDSINVQWQNRYKVNTEHVVHFGVEYRHPDLTEASVQINSGTAVDVANTDSRDIYGVYAQYQGQFSQVRLTAGARYDKYSDFGSTFNPRVAAVYQPLQETSFKLLYGSAFRAPSQSEVQLKNNISRIGNPNLQPETIETYEAVVVQKIASSSLSLSYFYSRTKDAIVLTEDTVPPTWINQGTQRYTGLEAELLSEFLEKDLSTRFSLSHITHSDQDIRITPETTISGIINYRYNKLNANLNGFYHSSTENDYSTTIKRLDAYTVFNTKLSYNITLDLMCYFEMQNIFDEDYKTPSIVGAPTFDVSNKGRLSYLGVEYSF